MGGECVIESLAIDILRMVGEMRPDRNWQIDVRSIWHCATGRRLVLKQRLSLKEMLLYIRNGMLGQILVNLGDNVAFHVRMKRMA
jgi:hypothetical protein